MKCKPFFVFLHIETQLPLNCQIFVGINVFSFKKNMQFLAG